MSMRCSIWGAHGEHKRIMHTAALVGIWMMLPSRKTAIVGISSTHASHLIELKVEKRQRDRSIAPKDDAVLVTIRQLEQLQ